MAKRNEENLKEGKIKKKKVEFVPQAKMGRGTEDEDKISKDMQEKMLNKERMERRKEDPKGEGEKYPDDLSEFNPNPPPFNPLLTPTFYFKQKL